MAETKEPSAPAASVGVKSDMLSLAGLASIVAGLIHATAAGSHSEHKQAVWAFAGCALFQLAWGVWALLRSSRLIAAIGVVGNAGFFGAWVLAKASGISFVDGLDEVEKVQVADGLCAALAAVSVLLAFAYLVGRPLVARQPRHGLLGVAAGVALVIALPGMVATGNHHHGAGGHDHGDGASTELAADGHEHNHGQGAVPPKEYDPNLPIDLSGVKGVTPQQQARAENLIALTLEKLPQWSDPAYAYKMGYRSIGDAGTGVEHFIKWDTINDKTFLDPDAPESLVYEVTKPERGFVYDISKPPEPGTRKLVSAMYMYTDKDTLESVPDIGGALTQFHVHTNLCFNTDPRLVRPGVEGPRVVGLTNGEGKCDRGFSLPPAPMIHVWITKHPCGPFAALEGVGAGQVKAGETKNCDHVHGSA
jgi:hypothetical protein